MIERKLPPIHPGEILLEEFLKPMRKEVRIYPMTPSSL